MGITVTHACLCRQEGSEGEGLFFTAGVAALDRAGEGVLAAGAAGFGEWGAAGAGPLTAPGLTFSVQSISPYPTETHPTSRSSQIMVPFERVR